MSTPHPAVQQITNSSPLTPAISSRWGFVKKCLTLPLWRVMMDTPIRQRRFYGKIHQQKYSK